MRLLEDLKPTELAQLYHLAKKYPRLIKWPVTAPQVVKALVALVGEVDAADLVSDAILQHSNKH